MIPQDENPFHSDFSVVSKATQAQTTTTSLINNPSNFEKYNGDDNSQLQNIFKNYPTVAKQSLKKTISDSWFSKHTSRLIGFFIPANTPLDIDTILN